MIGKGVDVDALPLSRFFFRPSEAAQIPLKSPGGGQGLCYARKEGTQRLTAGHTGILRFQAKQLLLIAIIHRHLYWQDGVEVIAVPLHTAFVNVAGALHRDELPVRQLRDVLHYRQASGLLLKPLDQPLMDGISNKVWSAQLLEEDTGQELFVTLTDPYTLYLQEHDQRNGVPTVRTAVYEREYSLFPETLQLALYEEPSDSLIFYWTNPPEEVYTPLEAMAVTKLEEKGLDRLLLVGCWYETQIQFCTGEGVWDEDGILLDWVTDETLYDGTIGIDEPLWFSLTIPEGVPNLCLHMKRPWDDSWYLWPITDSGGYLVSGWTFLTP